MSELSDTFRDAAIELLVEFGQEVTFTRIVEGAYDPSTGNAPDTPPINYSGFVAPEDYSLLDKNLTTISEKDSRLWCHKMDEEPLNGDTVVISGTNYRVMEVNRETVNGVNVLYNLQVRR